MMKWYFHSVCCDKDDDESYKKIAVVAVVIPALRAVVVRLDVYE